MHRHKGKISLECKAQPEATTQHTKKKSMKLNNSQCKTSYKIITVMQNMQNK
jgi:hypothetical protein